MRGQPYNRPAAGRVMWSTVEIAEVLGWEVHRVRRWLRREQAGHKYGRHWYANRLELVRVFGPEGATDIIANLPE